MSKTTYHLIHANIAEMLTPLDHPTMGGFVNRIDEIDNLAQVTPGFEAQPTPPDEGTVFSSKYTGQSLYLGDGREPVQIYLQQQARSSL